MSAETETQKVLDRLNSTEFQRYAAVLQELDPLDRYIMLLHDVRNFSNIVFNGQFYDCGIEDIGIIMHRRVDEFIQTPDQEFFDALSQLPPPLNESDSNRFVARNRRAARRIHPYLPQVLPTLRDSMGLLNAIGEGDLASEKYWLALLNSRRVPIRPLIEFYDGKLSVNGTLIQTDGLDVSGPEFVALLNLVKNSANHGLPTVEKDGSERLGMVDYDSVNDVWTVSNYSKEGVLPDIATYDSFLVGHYGLVIAGTNAVLLGKKLTSSVQEMDIDQLPRNVKRPQYKNAYPGSVLNPRTVYNVSLTMS